jgi:glycosyltransferase involved in cell wall biosynthesis
VADRAHSPVGAGRALSTVSSSIVSPDVTVVVPVYRNRATLRRLHRRLVEALEGDGKEFEALFVDDACPDGSLEVLRSLAVEDPRVSVLSLYRNVGQQRALMGGLATALGDRVVVMDADLQDPPEAVPRLLARLDRGPAAVFAGRRGRYESSARHLTSRLFKGALHRLSGIPADAGAFVAMDGRMVEGLLAFRESRPFLVAMIGATGLPVESIPVRRSPRLDGRSSYSAWRRLATAARALRWAWARRSRPSSVGTDLPKLPVRWFARARWYTEVGAPREAMD